MRLLVGHPLSTEIPQLWAAPWQVLFNVVDCGLRPDVPEDASLRYKRLLASCWHEWPENRCGCQTFCQQRRGASSTWTCNSHTPAVPHIHILHNLCHVHNQRSSLRDASTQCHRSGSLGCLSALSLCIPRIQKESAILATFWLVHALHPCEKGVTSQCCAQADIRRPCRGAVLDAGGRARHAAGGVEAGARGQRRRQWPWRRTRRRWRRQRCRAPPSGELRTVP